MDSSIERAASLINSSKKIIFILDFDFDGSSCNYISRVWTKRSGKDAVSLMSNNRFPRGIHEGLIEEAISNYKDGACIVTGDTGSDAINAFRKIKSVCPDMKIVVTDHHLIPDEDRLLGVIDVLVNPQSTTSTINKNWSGANVLWSLLKATEAADIEDLITTVLMANLVDQMSMADEENRNTYKTGAPMLKDIDMIKWALEEYRSNIAHDRFISMRLAPVLNSLQRFAMPEVMVRVMEGDKDAWGIALIINNKRKRKTKELLEQLKPQLRANRNMLPYMMALITYGAENKPYCGLIASAVSRDYSVPTLVINMSENTITGSARTVGDFKFKSAITTDGLKTMGHEGAFGILADSTQALKTAINRFIDESKKIDRKYDSGTRVKPINILDFESNMIDVDKGRPYGNSNPYPIFESTVTVTKLKLKSNNISIFYISDQRGGEIEAIYFGAIDSEVKEGSRISIIYEIEIDLDAKISVKEYKIVK